MVLGHTAIFVQVQSLTSTGLCDANGRVKMV